MTDPALHAIPDAPPDPRDVIIEVSDLTRSFARVQAVRGISFAIMRGQVVGFIGANGAGKTTTMRMMATLDVPSSGSIRIGGIDVVDYPGRVRTKIGWMPDSYGAYDNMTVWEYLDFYARAYGYRSGDRAQRVAEVMEFTDLTPISDRYMNKISKGMGQRLCLGRTLLHDPEVLILDEPAAGLDPKARIEFKHLIRLLAAEGKTIFISSHILSELGEMCDNLLFIDDGRIVHHGGAEELKRHDDGSVLVNVAVHGDPAMLHQWVAMNPGVTVVEGRKRGARIAFESNDAEFLARNLRKMIADGVNVIEFHREERKLEDAFVAMLKKLEGNGES